MTQKIVWVQDLDFMTTSGGAEQTDRFYFMEGVRRGHDMNVVTPQSGTVPMAKDDIAILSNITSFSHEMILNLPCRTVIFSHDYNFCVWRLYMPMSRKCLTDCPGFDYWNQLFEKSELNFFLSPLHKEVHELRFKDAIKPAFVTPSGIDVNQFKPLRKRREGYCNLNGLLTFKGRENLLEWARNHPDEHLDIGGAAEEPSMGRFDTNLPPNVKYVGPITQDRLNAWYNSHKYYIELPGTAQPYNRTVAEAYLSGCSLITNGLMGCTSYPWFTSRASVRSHLKSAGKKFWDRFESELKL